MKQVLFIGLDVDDQAYHGGIISEDGKETFEFKTKPTVGALVKKLKDYEEKGYQLKLCYEATYLGFSLCRDLRERKFNCEVIAPSLVPRKPGDKVKTDRIDGNKLARYYRNGDLTVVHMPSESQEQVRDLVRSRAFLSQQIKAIKLHILSLCRRMRIQYRKDGEVSSYWTQKHTGWLEEQLEKTPEELRFNLGALITTLKLLDGQKEKYDTQIEHIATSPAYHKQVQALCCYRGIDTLTAMVFITELGDISRFAHPKQITSFAGMDLMEFSSGGKERRYHMTKMGNRQIRTSAVEAMQLVFNVPTISKRLTAQRQEVDEKFIEIADRCMKRLHKKSIHLLYAGKMKNKIKVACARELLCFVWESLKAAA